MRVMFVPAEERKRMKAENDICRFAYCIVSGYITREPKTGETRKGEPKVQLGICYDSKKFQNVMFTGDNARTRIASCLEVHDDVYITGIWKSNHYTTQDGTEKEYEELYGDFIQVQQDLGESAAYDPVAPAQSATPAQSMAASIEEQEDDLPFD